MANRVYFTKEEDDELIDLIKSNPPLYNFKLKCYKNLSIKENIWQDIATKMKKRVPDCKIRWKSLRDYYQRKKRDNKKSTGSAASSSKLDPRYESLMFLHAMVDERKTISSTPIELTQANISAEEHTRSPPTIEENSEYFVVEENSEFESQFGPIKEDHIEEIVHIKQSERKGNNSAKSSSKQDIFYKEIVKGREERLKLLRKMTEQNTKVEKDGVDLFFESIASTVKTFPAAQIAKAKLAVLNVITEMELEVLSNSHSSTPTPTTYSDFEDIQTQHPISSFYCISLPPTPTQSAQPQPEND